MDGWMDGWSMGMCVSGERGVSWIEADGEVMERMHDR